MKSIKPINGWGNNMPKRKKKRKTNKTERKPRLMNVNEGEIFFIRKGPSGKYHVFGYNKSKNDWSRPIWDLGKGDTLLKHIADCASFIAAGTRGEKESVIAVGHVFSHHSDPSEKQKIRDFRNTR